MVYLINSFAREHVWPWVDQT